MSCVDHTVLLTLRCMFLDHLVNVTKLTRNTSHYVKEAAEGHDYIVVIDSEPRAALISLPDYRLLQEIKTRTGTSVTAGELSQLEASPNRLLAILGITNIDTWKPEIGWHATEHNADLVVPLGVTVTPNAQTGSTIVAVNLSNTVHGLMQGTTGAGKTNQLDEIALALCATYSPTRVNIIRFNASGASNNLNNPAHIVFDGGRSPLSGDADETPIQTLVAKLEHELSYRMQYLADLGVGDYTAYLKLRRTGDHTGAPLAQLVVLIDSYSNLIEGASQDLAAKLNQLFAELTQRGRTCGINVVLSDQSPREAHLRPLIVNIGYSVSLRTEANARLRLLPGSDASTQLPIEPGHGLISIRSDEPLIQFRGFGVHQPLPGATNSLSDALYLKLASASREWMTPLTPDKNAELIDVLGISDPAHPDIATLQTRRSADTGVQFPIGINPSGEPANLNITGGGTTGIMVGANSADLAELIRAAIYSLALTHSPLQANVIYLDAHNNGIADTIAQLPHVAAAIPNLASISTARARRESERVRLALLGELARRHALLKEASARDATAYRQHLDPDAADNQMPTLWIVINDYQDICRANLHWASLLTDIADRGRAVDVRITLVGRRPEPSTMSALKSSLGHRIALRTDTAEDSRAVIGSDRAYFLPHDAQGSALLRQGDTLSSFKALAMTKDCDDESVNVNEVLTQAIAAASHHHAHRIWLPPLEAPAPIDTLIESWRNKPWSQDYGDDDEQSHLWLPIGMVDRPFDLFQGVDAIDLATENVMVTGGSGAGKTTTLLTLAASACLLYTPDRLRLLCIGDERMRALEHWPHVAAWANSSDTEESARLIRVAKTIRDRRANEVKTHGAADDLSAIVLMVDDLEQCANNPTAMSAIQTLAQDKGRYGIHLIVSNARLLAFAHNAIQINLSPDAPLHWGVTSERDDIPDCDVLIGVPHIGDTDDAAAIQVSLQQATHFRHFWTVPRPTAVALSSLLPETPNLGGLDSIPFAVDTTMAEPVNLELGHRPHFLAVGRAASGKDNVLAAAAQSLMHLYTPEQLQIHVIDPASTLVGRISGQHVHSYCYEQQDISDTLAQLADTLKKRFPQPGLSQAELLEQRSAGWDGPRHIVIINDAHILSSTDRYSDPAHMPVIKLLESAQSIGLNVIAAQRADTWDSDSLIDPLTLGIRRTGSPTLFLNNDPATCQITKSIRGQNFPPGRGILLNSDSATTEILVAIAD